MSRPRILPIPHTEDLKWPSCMMFFSFLELDSRSLAFIVKTAHKKHILLFSTEERRSYTFWNNIRGLMITEFTFSRQREVQIKKKLHPDHDYYLLWLSNKVYVDGWDHPLHGFSYGNDAVSVCAWESKRLTSKRLDSMPTSTWQSQPGYSVIQHHPFGQYHIYWCHLSMTQVKIFPFSSHCVFQACSCFFLCQNTNLIINRAMYNRIIDF